MGAVETDRRGDRTPVAPGWSRRRVRGMAWIALALALRALWLVLTSRA